MRRPPTRVFREITEPATRPLPYGAEVTASTSGIVMIGTTLTASTGDRR